MQTREVAVYRVLRRLQIHQLQYLFKKQIQDDNKRRKFYRKKKQRRKVKRNRKDDTKHDERFEMAGQIFKRGIEKTEEESIRAKDI